FVSFDGFEGDPASPTHLQKYLYSAADPVGNDDPQGEDFTLASILIWTGFQADLISHQLMLQFHTEAEDWSLYNKIGWIPVIGSAAKALVNWYRGDDWSGLGNAAFAAFDAASGHLVDGAASLLGRGFSNLAGTSAGRLFSRTIRGATTFAHNSGL